MIRGSKLLYLTPVADRFFVVPGGHDLPTGDFIVATLDGHEYQVEPGALSRFEVSENAAQAHFRAQAQQAAADLGAAFGLEGAQGEQKTRAGLERFAEQLRAVSTALVAGNVDDLHAGHEAVADHGADLGDALGELTRYVRATRQQPQAESAQNPGGACGALADQVTRDQLEQGRRVDGSVERLERTLGPLIAADATQAREPRQERQAQYDLSARLAIAEALRAAGINPLGPTGEPGHTV